MFWSQLLIYVLNIFAKQNQFQTPPKSHNIVVCLKTKHLRYKLRSYKVSDCF